MQISFEVLIKKILYTVSLERLQLCGRFKILLKKRKEYRAFQDALKDTLLLKHVSWTNCDLYVW